VYEVEKLENAVGGAGFYCGQSFLCALCFVDYCWRWWRVDLMQKADCGDCAADCDAVLPLNRCNSSSRRRRSASSGKKC